MEQSRVDVSLTGAQRRGLSLGAECEEGLTGGTDLHRGGHRRWGTLALPELVRVETAVWHGDGAGPGCQEALLRDMTATSPPCAGTDCL